MDSNLQPSDVIGVLNSVFLLVEQGKQDEARSAVFTFVKSLPIERQGAFYDYLGSHAIKEEQEAAEDIFKMLKDEALYLATEKKKLKAAGI